jgi:hypothetical protein
MHLELPFALNARGGDQLLRGIDEDPKEYEGVPPNGIGIRSRPFETPLQKIAFLD